MTVKLFVFESKVMKEGNAVPSAKVGFKMNVAQSSIFGETIPVIT